MVPVSGRESREGMEMAPSTPKWENAVIESKHFMGLIMNSPQSSDSSSTKESQVEGIGN